MNNLYDGVALARERATASQDLMIQVEQCRLRDLALRHQYLANQIQNLYDQTLRQRASEQAAMFRRLIDNTNDAVAAARRHAQEALKARDAMRDWRPSDDLSIRHCKYPSSK